LNASPSIQRPRVDAYLDQARLADT